MPENPKEFLKHYELGVEASRLSQGPGVLELARTRELIERSLRPAPGVILDVGGGPGVYAAWLARKGYEVHLLDPVPLHVEQALEASRRQPESPIASARVGDARHLPWESESADAVLLLGPLYHLTERSGRLDALKEAARVLGPQGVLFAVGISRFASVLDGLWRHLLDDPAFLPIVERDLQEGQHRNPSHHPQYFTTAFFHRPEELEEEIREAGFSEVRVLAIEGPAWLLPSLMEDWQKPERRARLLDALRRIEGEPSLLGASAHLMATARKPA